MYGEVGSSDGAQLGAHASNHSSLGALRSHGVDYQLREYWIAASSVAGTYERVGSGLGLVPAALHRDESLMFMHEVRVSSDVLNTVACSRCCG